MSERPERGSWNDLAPQPPRLPQVHLCIRHGLWSVHRVGNLHILHLPRHRRQNRGGERKPSPLLDLHRRHPRRRQCGTAGGSGASALPDSGLHQRPWGQAAEGHCRIPGQSEGDGVPDHPGRARQLPQVSFVHQDLSGCQRSRNSIADDRQDRRCIGPAIVGRRDEVTE